MQQILRACLAIAMFHVQYQRKSKVQCSAKEAAKLLRAHRLSLETKVLRDFREQSILRKNLAELNLIENL